MGARYEMECHFLLDAAPSAVIIPRALGKATNNESGMEVRTTRDD